MRTCPTQSWVNPAEIVMCILNYVLQHCTLEREKMEEDYENKMRNKNTMNEVHFRDSMVPEKSLLKKRFENMKIKEEYIECASSASKDELDQFFDVIHLIDETIEKDKLSPKDVESSEKLS